MAIFRAKSTLLKEEHGQMARALHNPHFWSILVIARSEDLGDLGDARGSRGRPLHLQF